MHVVIIGRGNMGSPLARLAQKSGHEVTLVGRGDDVAKAAAAADLILLAIHFESAKSLLSDAATAASLEGKVLVDITNPLAPDFMSLTVGHDTSAAELLAKLAPGTRVIKAFNTVFADLLKRRADGGDCPVPVYVAGDDPTSRLRVMQFVASIGFEAVDCGPLHNARYLEPMAEMMIQLGYGLGHGADVGFAFVKAA